MLPAALTLFLATALVADHRRGRRRVLAPPTSGVRPRPVERHEPSRPLLATVRSTLARTPCCPVATGGPRRSRSGTCARSGTTRRCRPSGTGASRRRSPSGTPPVAGSGWRARDCRARRRCGSATGTSAAPRARRPSGATRTPIVRLSSRFSSTDAVNARNRVTMMNVLRPRARSRARLPAHRRPMLPDGPGHQRRRLQRPCRRRRPATTSAAPSTPRSCSASSGCTAAARAIPSAAWCLIDPLPPVLSGVTFTGGTDIAGHPALEAAGVGPVRLDAWWSSGGRRRPVAHRPPGLTRSDRRWLGRVAGELGHRGRGRLLPAPAAEQVRRGPRRPDSGCMSRWVPATPRAGDRHAVVRRGDGPVHASPPPC